MCAGLMLSVCPPQPVCPPQLADRTAVSYMRVCMDVPAIDDSVEWRLTTATSRSWT
jgi:hypothetical protein